MSNAILGAAVIVLVFGLIVVVYLETRLIRDESTAARMERADLLQRIQAPGAAVAEHSYSKVADEVGPMLDAQDAVDEEWASMPDSIVPFDEDLMFE